MPEQTGALTSPRWSLTWTVGQMHWFTTFTGIHPLSPAPYDPV
jgi:hypothetical protein